MATYVVKYEICLLHFTKICRFFFIKNRKNDKWDCQRELIVNCHNWQLCINLYSFSICVNKNSFSTIPKIQNVACLHNSIISTCTLKTILYVFQNQSFNPEEESAIYNHLNEKLENTQETDSPYDHAQYQKNQPDTILDSDYMHINKL